MFEIFVLFGQCLCRFLPGFVNRQPCPHTIHATSPDAPQKPLVRKRARSGRAEWVHVTHSTFPFTSRAMCAPIGSQILWRGTTMTTIQIPNNQWPPVHCSVPCILQVPALCSIICDHLRSPNPHISETAFSRRSIYKSIHIRPPRERNFGTSDQKFRNPRKGVKTHHVGT